MKKHLFTSNKGYIYCNGKVQALTIETYVFHENGDITLYGRLGGKFWSEKQTQEKHITAIYPTEEDCVNHTNAFGIIDRNIYPYNFVGDIDNCSVGYVRTSDGMKEVELSSLEVKVTEKNGLYNSCFVEYDKVYQTAILYNADNDVEVIEGDGTSHIRKSLISRIALTDEQTKLFQNLCDAFKACKDAKIGLYRAGWSNGIYAVNNADEDIVITTYEDNYDMCVDAQLFFSPYGDNIETYSDDDCYQGIFVKEVKKNN